MAADAPLTFHKDVEPILQQHCQSCHRPGEIAPMPLLTYQEARPWAKAIRASVQQKLMPPWFADPAHGEFANDRTLSPSRDRDGGGLGRERRARGRPQGRAGADRVERRLEHRRARRRPRDADRVQGPGDRHHPLPVHRLPHRLHRGQVGREDRGAAGEPRRRPPHDRFGVAAQPGDTAGPVLRSREQPQPSRLRQDDAVRRRTAPARRCTSSCPAATPRRSSPVRRA